MRYLITYDIADDSRRDDVAWLARGRSRSDRISGSLLETGRASTAKCLKGLGWRRMKAQVAILGPRSCRRALAVGPRVWRGWPQPDYEG